MSLRQVVAFLAIEAGFETAHESCLDALVKLLDNYLMKLATSCKNYAEVAERTGLMATDIMSSIEDSGIKLSEIVQYHKNSRQKTMPMPEQSQECLPEITNMNEREHRDYLPDHVPENFPGFPKNHTYIKTKAYEAPNTEWARVKDRFSMEKADELRLTSLLARNKEAFSFGAEVGSPCIANKCNFKAIVQSLNHGASDCED